MNTVVDLVRLRRIDLSITRGDELSLFPRLLQEIFRARPPNLVERREGRLFI